MSKTLALPILASGIILALCNGANADKTIPTRVIEIYNNSTDHTIYPVIYTSKPGVDQWLQAYFQNTGTQRNSGNYNYPEENQYRAWIEPTKGIGPGGHVKVELPLYTTLSSTPNPKDGSSYIDWWNGGRIEVFDDFIDPNTQPPKEKMVVAEIYETERTKAQPSLKSPGVSCIEGCREAIAIYQDPAGLPPNSPSQLVEFTFSAAITKVTGDAPFGWDDRVVDYDVSYVDHTYWPVAIEPLGNKNFIGYTGTVTKIDQNGSGRVPSNGLSFREAMTKFLQDYAGWKEYSFGGKAMPRIPGAYNVLIGPDSLYVTPIAGQTLKNMADLWQNCVDHSGSSPDCPNLVAVRSFFDRAWHYSNDQPAKGLDCGPAAETETLLRQYAYGWVAFTTPKCPSIDLKSTPGTPVLDSVQLKNYLPLEYNYQTNPNTKQIFNPYVRLIHDPAYLAMSAYAFSVDDAVGNMQEIGNGLVYAFGGPQGLPIPKPYDPATIFYVNTGGPPDFQKWLICPAVNGQPAPSCDANSSDGSPFQNRSFKVAEVDYPVTLSLIDGRGRPYTLVVPRSPDTYSDSKAWANGNGSSCAAPNPSWCSGLDPNIQPAPNGVKVWNLNTQPPLP